MFYVKAEISDGVTIKAEIADNVFTLCPQCGREHAVDLSETFPDGDVDLYSTQVFCAECSMRRAKNHPACG